MIRAACLLLALLLWPYAPARATPLIGDLSNYRIDIDSSFNGTRLFVFGARNDDGDIVVIVRGPERDFIVRKKEPIAGVWVNRERMKFFGVPDFYAVASSRPLEDMEPSAAARRLGIGENMLLKAPADPRLREGYDGFAAAYLRYAHGERLYMTEPENVTFMGETLFKTVVTFPDNIPPGIYTAEIYLLSGGEVVGMQSMPIDVVKSGLDALLYNFAHLYPGWYGLFAVGLALLTGWFASRVFDKA